MKKFNVPLNYRSDLITAIKNKRRQNDQFKKDFTPSLLNFGDVHIYLARHFGFCYGVENAIEISFKTIEENPGRKIYLLSEMIHNPLVNDDLTKRGVRFLMDTKGNMLVPFSNLTANDIVIVPAFGTTLQIEEQLSDLGIEIKTYNTTCPFVEKVWNRAEQIASRGYSIVVHGKPRHEETRATFSHAAQHTPTVIVNNLAEAENLAAYIKGEKGAKEFEEEFSGRFSEGFDPTIDLQKINIQLSSMANHSTKKPAPLLVTVLPIRPQW